MADPHRPMNGPAGVFWKGDEMKAEHYHAFRDQLRRVAELSQVAEEKLRNDWQRLTHAEISLPLKHVVDEANLLEFLWRNQQQ